jgi:DNA-binding transcriptional MocR family regulator
VAQLRQAIADRYTARGLPTTREEILITAGAQNALALLLRSLTRPGRAVVVEQPTYPHALHAIEGAGCRTRAVPLFEGEWERARLTDLLREPGVDLAYLVPDHQNPTGMVMTGDLRRQVLHDAQAGSAMVIFDETLTDLWFKQPPPSADLDHPRLIRTGSLAKSVWGGLRLGWIRAAATVIDTVATARTALDLGVPVLEQLAGCHLLARPERLQARREELRERRDLLAQLLREALPTWRFQTPPGGLALWVELGSPIATSYAALAERRGVRVAAGPRFGVGRALERYVRLAYCRPEAELRRATSGLASAYSDATGAGVADPSAPDSRLPF